MNNKIGPASQKQEDFLMSDADITVYGGSVGCLRADAEFLTPSGWKRFDEYEAGDLVGQYNHDNGCLEYVEPEEYIKLPCDKFYRMQARGLDFTLTPEHRVPYFTRSREDSSFQVISFGEVIERHKRSAREGWGGKIKTTFKTSQKGVDLTDTQIRLMVAVQADGHFPKNNSTNNVRVLISKERKVARLEWLLNSLSIPFKKKTVKDDNYTTGFKHVYVFESPRKEKIFGDYWYSCSQHQLEVLMDEVGHWDSALVENSCGVTTRYSSNHKVNADFIQYAAHACGYNTSLVSDPRSEKYRTGTHYTVNCTKRGRGFRSFANKDGKCEITEVQSEDGYKYCFTVPSSFLVVRVSNKIFITGNSGKSYVGLMTPLLYVDDPHFRGVVFRRTMPEITAGGGLWDTARQLYTEFDPRVEFRERDKVVIFPSGATLKFSHLEMEADKFKHQGAQYTFELFDEGTHFTETQVDYLRSRLRSANYKYPTLMKITCNPDYDSFLRKWVEWYLDPVTGIPDPEKAGALRWFKRQGDELHWANSKEELVELYGDRGIKSFRFIPATIYDNPPLIKNNPDYLDTLESLGRVEKERLLYGSWYARPEEEGYWKRDWITFVDKPPLKVKKRVRAWDLAGSVPSETYPNPDWTVGVRMSMSEDGDYYIEDVCRFRDRYQGVFQNMLQCAKEDGADTEIIVPCDPGSAGRALASQIIRDLADKGFYARMKQTNKNKVTRFAPFASISEAGFVCMVRSDWNDTYTDELEAFDGSRNKKDDYDILHHIWSSINPLNFWNILTRIGEDNQKRSPKGNVQRLLRRVKWPEAVGTQMSDDIVSSVWKHAAHYVATA